MQITKQRKTLTSREQIKTGEKLAIAWDQLFSISTRKRELGNTRSQRKSMRRMKLWKDSFRCLPECLKPSLVMPDSPTVMKNKMNRKEKDTCLRSVERQGKDIIWFYISWIFYYVNQGPFSQINMNLPTQFYWITYRGLPQWSVANGDVNNPWKGWQKETGSSASDYWLTIDKEQLLKSLITITCL